MLLNDDHLLLPCGNGSLIPAVFFKERSLSKTASMAFLAKDTILNKKQDNFQLRADELNLK